MSKYESMIKAADADDAAVISAGLTSHDIQHTMIINASGYHIRVIGKVTSAVMKEVRS